MFSILSAIEVLLIDRYLCKVFFQQTTDGFFTKWNYAFLLTGNSCLLLFLAQRLFHWCMSLVVSLVMINRKARGREVCQRKNKWWEKSSMNNNSSFWSAITRRISGWDKRKQRLAGKSMLGAEIQRNFKTGELTCHILKIYLTFVLTKT